MWLCCDDIMTETSVRPHGSVDLCGRLTSPEVAAQKERHSVHHMEFAPLTLLGRDSQASLSSVPGCLRGECPCVD